GAGRRPFHPESQGRIEAQNPGVLFDWPRLLATPIPPPSADVERWRERRQAEKAEKAAQAARRADLDPRADEEVEPASDQAEPMAPDVDEAGADAPGDDAVAVAKGAEGIVQPEPDTADPQQAAGKRRRRRRRRRR